MCREKESLNKKIHTMTKNLFSPIQVGNMKLKSRVVMAPLTRFRSPNHILSDMVVQYYEQRSRIPGSLLISEATYVSPAAVGYRDTPGIFTPEQVQQWRKVTDAVHANNSFLFIQLWALGKAADKNYLDELGLDYVAPSSIPNPVPSAEYIKKLNEVQTWNRENPNDKKPEPPRPEPKIPKELTEAEIEDYIEQFGVAAANCIRAGADGIEIHNANGYLIEQFLFEGSNKRTDKWGGSIENRARFSLAIVDKIVSTIGQERTGIRLSPWRNFVTEEAGTPIEQWKYLIEQLNKRYPRLAYVHFIEPRGALGANANAVYNKTATNDIFEKLWDGVMIRAGGFTRESAITETDKNDKLLIAMGRYYIANPDLVSRWEHDRSLNNYDRSTFYTSDSKGYIDYPFYSKV